MQERTVRRGARFVWMCSAVVLPLAVAVAFGFPTERIILPESLMLTITVLLTLVGGVVPGIVSALASTLCLWFFSFPPGLSFRAAHPADVVAAAIAGLFACALVVLISVMLGRQHRAIESQTQLRWELRVQAETIATMQHALLPERMPTIEHVTIGWHYTPGGPQTAPIGGDWFTVVPVSTTQLGIAIGDVAGHGLSAVTQMAEYRYALSALAAGGASPPAVLQDVGEICRLYGMRPFSTCVYGLLDTNTNRWTYTSAGHPPPMLIRDGSVTTLEAPHGPPIGVGAGSHEYGNDVVSLQSNDLIALYTDGLIERRGENLDTGIDRLATCLRLHTGRGDLSECCSEVIDELAGQNPADDVALLLVRFNEPTTAASTAREE